MKCWRGGCSNTGTETWDLGVKLCRDCYDSMEGGVPKQQHTPDPDRQARDVARQAVDDMTAAMQGLWQHGKTASTKRRR